MLLNELFSLQGKTALVTGGAGLLGGQIAEALAELGADIIIASRDQANCKLKCEALQQQFDISAWPIKLDIADKDSINQCIATAKQEAGGFDILVACAWSGRKNDWETINDEDWDNDIEICLNGVFRLIKASTEILKERRGVILTVGSMYGHVAPDYRLYEDVPQANPPSYGAAKAGIIQLTKYLASFLAPHGIRANCISPGPFPFEETANEYPDFIDRLSNKNPMARIGSKHEIKGAAALLCSDASSYMTGQNLCVDGGWCIW